MCIERNIVIFVGAVLILLFLYTVYKNNVNMNVDMGMYEQPEYFDQDIVPKPVPIVMGEGVEGGEGRAPDVNPEVGSIINGPGFERGGEVDGIDQSIYSKIPSDYYFLSDGADGKYSITSGLYSKSCCSAQWPTGIHMKYDPYVCNNKDQYTGSNIFGSSTYQDSGCLCMPKDTAKFLYNRGGNGKEWW